MNPRIPNVLSGLASPPPPQLELPLLDDGRLDCLTLVTQPDWSKRAPLFLPLTDGPVESMTRAEQMLVRLYLTRVAAVAAQASLDVYRAALAALAPSESGLATPAVTKLQKDTESDIELRVQQAELMHGLAHSILAVALNPSDVLGERDAWPRVVTVSLSDMVQGVA